MRSEPVAAELERKSNEQSCERDQVGGDHTGDRPAVIGDMRVAKVLRELEARPEDFPNMAEAAAKAGLSPSRFRALFQQHVGLPFRRYRLWRRMAVVANLVRDGSSLTRAALVAGFSSSAHLSSTFHEMFGLSPSSLLALDIQIDVEQRSGRVPPRATRTKSSNA